MSRTTLVCWTCTEAAQIYVNLGDGDCAVCRRWPELQDKANWDAIATRRDGSPCSRQTDWQQSRGFVDLGPQQNDVALSILAAAFPEGVDLG